MKASRNLIRLILSTRGSRCPNRCFRCKTRLDRVKDKDYINVNLTYELDKLTKGNQQLGSGEWSLIAESIDPSAVRQFIIQYNIAMQKQLAAHPELANDEVALQEVNAALFKEYLPLLQKVSRPLNNR